MMEMEYELYSTQTEMIIVGTFFKEPTMSFTYMDMIKNEDFHDKGMAFFHNFFTDYILTYSEEFTQAKANTFASMNTVRLSGYRKFGGWKTISDLIGLAVNHEEFKNQFDVLKKYSLLRGLNKGGYDVSKILSHPKFNSLTADVCADLIRGNIDKVCSRIITGIDEPIDLAANGEDIMDSYLEAPEQGWTLPWKFLNERTRGLIPGDSLGVCAASNSGKGRSLIYLASFLAYHEGANVAFYANEMDANSMATANYVTLINAPWAKEIHGYDTDIREREFTLGIYRDSSGNIIYRNVDKYGNYTETVEEYKNRIAKLSSNYRDIKKVMKWVGENGKNKLLFKSVASDYSDSSLIRIIRQDRLIRSCDVWFYDTLKHGTGSDISSWADLVQTTTRLVEENQKLKTGAIMSIQMVDAAQNWDMDQMSSEAVASAKHLFHLFSQMMIIKHLRPDEYAKYKLMNYRGQWGEFDEYDLANAARGFDSSTHITGVKLIKNRRGSKGGLIALESCLDKNVWREVADLKSTKSF